MEKKKETERDTYYNLPTPKVLTGGYSLGPKVERGAEEWKRRRRREIHRIFPPLRFLRSTPKVLTPEDIIYILP